MLDEPTELPEGEAVDLVPVDAVLVTGGDCLDEGERERLHRALQDGLGQARRGETVAADVVLASLRARR